MSEVYEIINPSDKCTIVGELEVCRAAVLILANGQYALEDKDGGGKLPLFLFGGFEAWAKNEGFDLERILTDRRVEVAEALATVALGSFADRADFDDARRLMEPEKFQEFVRFRNDRRRSSLTNIEAVAHEMSRRMLEPQGGK